jgi:hypothetical protein
VQDQKVAAPFDGQGLEVPGPPLQPRAQRLGHRLLGTPQPRRGGTVRAGAGQLVHQGRFLRRGEGREEGLGVARGRFEVDADGHVRREGHRARLRVGNAQSRQRQALVAVQERAPGGVMGDDQGGRVRQLAGAVLARPPQPDGVLGGCPRRQELPAAGIPVEGPVLRQLAGVQEQPRRPLQVDALEVVPGQQGTGAARRGPGQGQLLRPGVALRHVGGAEVAVRHGHEEVGPAGQPRPDASLTVAQLDIGAHAKGVHLDDRDADGDGRARWRRRAVVFDPVHADGQDAQAVHFRPQPDDLAHAVHHAGVGQQQGLRTGGEQAVPGADGQGGGGAGVAQRAQGGDALEGGAVEHEALGVDLPGRDGPGPVARGVGRRQVQVLPVLRGTEHSCGEVRALGAGQRDLDALHAGLRVPGDRAGLQADIQRGPVAEADPAGAADLLETDQAQAGREQGGGLGGKLQAHGQGQDRQAFAQGLVWGVDEQVVVQEEVRLQVERALDHQLLPRDEMGDPAQHGHSEG